MDNLFADPNPWVLTICGGAIAAIISGLFVYWITQKPWRGVAGKQKTPQNTYVGNDVNSNRRSRSKLLLPALVGLAIILYIAIVLLLGNDFAEDVFNMLFWLIILIFLALFVNGLATGDW